MLNFMIYDINDTNNLTLFTVHLPKISFAKQSAYQSDTWLLVTGHNTIIKSVNFVLLCVKLLIGTDTWAKFYKSHYKCTHVHGPQHVWAMHF
jgi:hypothetical protein